MGMLEPVDGLHYEHIDSRYRTVQIVLAGFGYIILAGLALLLLLLDDCIWCIIAECVILTALAINMAILRKAWSFKGYALREHDISYRSGVIFPKITTIPFNRMQQVSVKQNPVSRLLHLYSVDVVNGAQELSSMTIPGLSEERANQIKGIVIERMRHDPD